MGKSDPAIRIRCAVALLKEGRLLLAKHFTNDFWVLPGGTLEFGESVGSAAVREIKEETGLDIRLGPLFSVSDFIARNRQVVDFIFLGDVLGGEFRITREENVESMRWVPLSEAATMNLQPKAALERLIAHLGSGQPVGHDAYRWPGTP